MVAPTKTSRLAVVQTCVRSPVGGVVPTQRLPCTGASADPGPPPALGSTVYTCMLNQRGGTESDLTVSRLAPGTQASALAPAFAGKRCPRGHSHAGTAALL